MTTQRLDKWLWFARFAKTRSLAAKLCGGGGVTVGGVVVAKSNHAIRVGDSIVVSQGRFMRQVTVLGLGERRGPAPEARLLYAEPNPPAPVPKEEWVTLFEDEAAG